MRFDDDGTLEITRDELNLFKHCVASADRVNMHGLIVEPALERVGAVDGWRCMIAAPDGKSLRKRRKKGDVFLVPWDRIAVFLSLKGTEPLKITRDGVSCGTLTNSISDFTQPASIPAIAKVIPKLNREAKSPALQGSLLADLKILAKLKNVAVRFYFGGEHDPVLLRWRYVEIAYAYVLMPMRTDGPEVE